MFLQNDEKLFWINNALNLSGDIFHNYNLSTIGAPSFDNRSDGLNVNPFCFILAAQ